MTSSGDAPLPLTGYVVQAADRPAARQGGRLLAALGVDVTTVRQEETLRCGDLAISGLDTTPLQDWAQSGLMTLTTNAEGNPLRPRGLAATVARGAAHSLDLVTRIRAADPVVVDGAQLLGERAALTGRHELVKHRRARLLLARDGAWALNLARDEDLEMLPALVQRDTAGSWEEIAAWSAHTPASDAVARARLLGLAAARLGETSAPGVPWTVHTRVASTPGRSRPRVVNLGALWAAPLAANLLSLAGFDVVHVESEHRPDASRWGDPALYDLLRGGSNVEVVDFRSASGLARLRGLLEDADVVVEASRPRALRSLGVDRDTIATDGRARTWLRITAHGGRGPHWIGFGDDTAVAGGLVADDPHGMPALAGDAIADPLTGLIGALAVLGHHDTRRITHLDLALADVAAYCAAAGSFEWPERLPRASVPRHR